MKAKNVAKFALFPLGVLLILTGCSSSPSPGAVETAIALTRAAEPTSTPTPKPTSTPTNTPTPEPTATSTPQPLPAIFVRQLTKFLDDSTRITGATSQGVAYRRFGDLLADARGSYDLVLSTWPAHIPTSSLDNFDKAFEGWDLVDDLWWMQINKKDNPVQPDINGFAHYLAYAGEFLVIAVHPNSFIVPEYRGKQYLPFDENISALMSVARAYFDDGKEEALLIIGD
jgi:hypothetical protein